MPKDVVFKRADAQVQEEGSDQQELASARQAQLAATLESLSE